MNYYQYLQKLLFLLPPEQAHHLSLSALKLKANAEKLVLPKPKSETQNIQVMGLSFPNKIGLAAGLDKNGEYIDALASLGFGFIEVGTVTPRPQPGNPTPRLFRIPKHQAIINRMGFNNKGIDNLVKNVRNTEFKGILGINIGKNADTPIDNAVNDYLIGLEKAYEFASYVTVNISSPNTKNLRALQETSAMYSLLDQLKNKQSQLQGIYNRYVPIVIKVAPDLEQKQVEEISELLIKFKVDGLIATNTTIDHSMLPDDCKYKEETGGLSGQPVFKQSTKVLEQFTALLGNNVPVIAAGGIDDSTKAAVKLKKGAKLVQIYTGLIYKGPSLVRKLTQA